MDNTIIILITIVIIALLGVIGWSINTVTPIEAVEDCMLKDMEYTNRTTWASSTPDQRLWAWRSCAWVYGGDYTTSVNYEEFNQN